MSYVPSPLSRRMGAALIDLLLCTVIVIPLTMLAGIDGGPSGAVARISVLWILLALIGASEGPFGGVGKRWLGLSLRTEAGEPASLGVSLVRALVFNVATPALVLRFISESAYLDYGRPATGVFLALFFLPARTQNGWRAAHDRLTGTRVMRSSSNPTIP